MKLMKQFSHGALITGIALLFFFLLTNCEEKPLEVGLDLMTEDELLDVIVDTLPAELYTVTDEAINTKSIGASPLGVVNDTVIGVFEAEYIADFIYDEEIDFLGVDTNTLEILDFKLHLSYDDSYGDSMDIQFNVFELLEPMPDYDKSDYQMYDHMYESDPLNTSQPYKLGEDTSVYVVDMSEEFGNRLLEKNLIVEGLYDSDNLNFFKEQFKGFYFAVEPRTEPGGGVITVNNRTSRMILNARGWNPDSSRWDTITSYFSIGNPSSTIDTGGVHLNLYSNTLTSAVEGALDDFSTLRKRAYVHSLSGPRVLVRIPALEEIREEHEGEISVNFAKLIIPFDGETYLRDYDLYHAPNNLGLHDSVMQSPILDDVLAENHLGGDLDSTAYEYRFNIGNHVNEYLSSADSEYSNSLFMFASTGTLSSAFEYTPARIVLLQDSSIGKYPRVRIVYSIIPK